MLTWRRIMSRLARAGCVIAALVAFAPSALQAQVTLGARGGINLATVAGDNTENVSSRVGLNLGATVRVALSDLVDLQFGAGLSSRGTKDKDGTEEIEFRVDYLEIPVHLRFNLPSTGSTSAHFVVGPTLGINTACEVEVEDENRGTLDEDRFSVSFDCDSPESELDIQTFDLGATAGAGVDFGLGNGMAITLDALYTLGLVNITDDQDDNAKNRGFSFLAGLSLPVG
jgi:Outer membrane protein beta-barrel domain